MTNNTTVLRTSLRVRDEMVAELELFLRQYLLFFLFVLQRKNGPPSALYTDTSVTLRSYIIWNGMKNRPEAKCGRWTKLLSIAFYCALP